MSFFVCWLAGLLLAAAIQSFGLVWFGFSSVFCTASASASRSSSGVSLGGGFAASRKADEKRREQKRRKERCSFLKGFELIYQSVSLQGLVLCLTAAINRHFAASRSLSFVFQQSPSARLRLRGEVSLFQIFFSFFFPGDCFSLFL
jgi:hypothetical protein